jgi:hypothetical protein
MAITSYDTQFSFGATIGEVMNLSLGGISVNPVETSHLRSTSNAKTFISGMIDAGEISLTINYAKAQFNTLIGLLRSSQAFVLTMPDSSTLTGSGILTSLGLEIPEDDRVTVPITVKISGLPVWASS